MPISCPFSVCLSLVPVWPHFGPSLVPSVWYQYLVPGWSYCVWHIPESKGESREGVDRGDDFNAEDTASEVDADVPLLVDPTILPPPIFLAGFMRELRLNLSLGGGCCLACCRHLALRFLNHTLKQNRINLHVLSTGNGYCITWTLDSGRLIFSATSSRIKMSGYLVLENRDSRTSNCALVNVVRSLRCFLPG